MARAHFCVWAIIKLLNRASKNTGRLKHFKYFISVSLYVQYIKSINKLLINGVCVYAYACVYTYILFEHLMAT